jgi:hypothetical protein
MHIAVEKHALGSLISTFRLIWQQYTAAAATTLTTPQSVFRRQNDLL